MKSAISFRTLLFALFMVLSSSPAPVSADKVQGVAVVFEFIWRFTCTDENGINDPESGTCNWSAGSTAVVGSIVAALLLLCCCCPWCVERRKKKATAAPIALTIFAPSDDQAGLRNGPVAPCGRRPSDVAQPTTPSNFNQQSSL